LQVAGLPLATEPGVAGASVIRAWVAMLTAAARGLERSKGHPVTAHY